MGNAQEIISNRVKEERTRRGWSQSGLAERAGVDRKTVNRLENQQHYPNWDSLNAIATALGMPMRDLFTEKG